MEGVISKEITENEIIWHIATFLEKCKQVNKAPDKRDPQPCWKDPVSREAVQIPIVTIDHKQDQTDDRIYLVNWGESYHLGSIASTHIF